MSTRWRVSPVSASLTCAEILIRLVETDPLRGLLRGIPPTLPVRYCSRQLVTAPREPSVRARAYVAADKP